MARVLTAFDLACPGQHIPVKPLFNERYKSSFKVLMLMMLHLYQFVHRKLANLLEPKFHVNSVSEVVQAQF